MHALNDDVRTLAKPALYEELESNLRGLLAGEPNLTACAANMSSLLYWSLPDLNWAGFYLLDETSGDLLVGLVPRHPRMGSQPPFDLLDVEGGRSCARRRRQGCWHPHGQSGLGQGRLGPPALGASRAQG